MSVCVLRSVALATVLLAGKRGGGVATLSFSVHVHSITEAKRQLTERFDALLPETLNVGKSRCDERLGEILG